MKELEKLKAAAGDAYVAYSAGVDARVAAYAVWDNHTVPSDTREIALSAYAAACRMTDTAWDAYIAACEAARRADDAAKANAYEAEGNTTDTFQITTFEDKILFTHSSKGNAILKTVEKAVADGVDLTEAYLVDVKLLGGKLKGAKLRDATLRHSDLRGADLRQSDLRGTDLRGSDLRNCDLRCTNLGGTNLGGANLRGARYTQSQLNFSITDTATIF